MRIYRSLSVRSCLGLSAKNMCVVVGGNENNQDDDDWQPSWSRQFAVDQSFQLDIVSASENKLRIWNHDGRVRSRQKQNYIAILFAIDFCDRILHAHPFVQITTPSKAAETLCADSSRWRQSRKNDHLKVMVFPRASALGPCCAEPGGGNVRTFQNFHFFSDLGSTWSKKNEEKFFFESDNISDFRFQISDFQTFRLSDFQSKFVESITQKLSRFST